jgi:hypothetical protein
LNFDSYSVAKYAATLIVVREIVFVDVDVGDGENVAVVGADDVAAVVADVVAVVDYDDDVAVDVVVAAAAVVVVENADADLRNHRLEDSMLTVVLAFDDGNIAVVVDNNAEVDF